MRWKSRRCPSEASFSSIHTDRSAWLVAFKSQTWPDGHPLFVTDIVGLSWALTAGAVLSERKIGSSMNNKTFILSIRVEEPWFYWSLWVNFSYLGPRKLSDKYLLLFINSRRVVIYMRCPINFYYSLYTRSCVDNSRTIKLDHSHYDAKYH